jgi:hypothetical protein
MAAVAHSRSLVEKSVDDDQLPCPTNGFTYQVANVAGAEQSERRAVGSKVFTIAFVFAMRAAVDRYWQQRLERTRYQTERARRQYDACEPENRLVARTLEGAWEEALAEQVRLEAEHDRVLREQPTAISPAEVASIRALAQDLPALWQADTTTQEERQSIIRLLLLERVLVEVIGNKSEQVRVGCHSHGGIRTQHRMVRPNSRTRSGSAPTRPWLPPSKSTMNFL